MEVDMRTLHTGIVCALFMLLAIGSRAQNLLKNPGFETLGPDGLPADWTREYNPKLSVPLEVTADARAGKRAVCLMTEDWNYTRPQFVTQDVPLPKGATACHLTAACKGQGLVNLVFVFRKAGKPLEVEDIDMGFGPVQAPREERHAFGLEQDYQPYTFSAAIPAGADSVRVKVGNTAALLGRLNLWGKVYIDDVALTADTRPDPPAAATQALIPTVETPPGLLDVAPQSRLWTEPASFDTGALVDGDVATTYACQAGVGRAGNVDASFPQPLPVRGVQVYLNGLVSALTVRGDADGDGHYETLLGRADNLSGKGWLTLTVAGKPVRGLRVQAIDGSGLCDVRISNPILNEIKILAPAARVNRAAFARWAVFQPREPLKPGVPAIALQPLDAVISPAANPRFHKMVCADLWMWGVNVSQPDAPLTDLRNSENFKRTVARVKALGVNWVEVDLTDPSSRNLMPWPSKLARGTRENHLKPLIDALHAEGFKVVVELLHNITPFETVKWHFPMEETSRYPGMKQYPSIAHGTYFRDNWLAIEEEIMACGADGVGLGADEACYKPAFLPTLPADDPGRQLYRERYGHDLPEHEADTLAFRQWVILRHEGICGVYGYVAQALRKQYPGIYLNSMWMQPTSGCSYVTEVSIPWDLMAYRGGITEMGSDYMGPNGVRMAAAVNGWRGATMVYSGNLGGTLPDLHYYSSVMWSWMYGAGSANYWRFNWIDEAPASYAALQRAYRISDDLEALGAYDARPPHRIAMLSSRASLDWWQVNAWWGKHGAGWDRGLQGQRAWFADETLFNILQQNGCPFDWKWLDRPDHLQELGGYRVLIVPFAYAISREAADRVKAAVKDGATLILLAGHQGETDEWGEPYAAPVFKELVDSGKAILLRDDLMTDGSTDRFVEQVTGAIDKALGTENPLKLTRYHQHIEATVLRKNAREYFLFAINGEKAPATIDLGVAVPPGEYRVFARDIDRWNRVTLNGKATLTAQNLANFRAQIPAEQPSVFYIAAQGVSSPLTAGQ